MAIAVKDLIDAGVHYGHRASRWNPKMKPYIYGKRNLIHIIDLKETVRGLLRSIKYFNRVAAGGGLVLFVGTKRQAVDIVIEQAQRCNMPYVTERWLGGTLTNFQTIRSRLDRLEELEAMLDSDQALTYSKKALSSLNRERRKIQRNLEGIRHMTRQPEAMFVIDPHREKIAVNEARKLGVKVVALMDTDCDPDFVDLPIPGNDDSMRAIELILSRLSQSIIDGRAAAPPEQSGRGGPGSQGQPSGSRGRLERRSEARPGTENEARGPQDQAGPTPSNPQPTPTEALSPSPTTPPEPAGPVSLMEPPRAVGFPVDQSPTAAPVEAAPASASAAPQPAPEVTAPAAQPAPASTPPQEAPEAPTEPASAEISTPPESQPTETPTEAPVATEAPTETPSEKDRNEAAPGTASTPDS